MKVILITFLSLFLIVFTLFIFTFISSNTPYAGNDKSIADAGVENSKRLLSGSSIQPETGMSGENSAVAPQSSFEKSINNKTEDSINALNNTGQTNSNAGTNEPETGTVQIQNSGDKNSDNRNDAASDKSGADKPENTGTDHVSLPEGFKVRKIIYQSNRNGNEDLYSINLDGSGLQRLTDNPGNDLYPEVSPDGKKIAYTADINGIWQIVIMSPDGSNKIQITNNYFRSGYPSWSFNGKFIYFEGLIDGDWELFRINSDGSNQVRLTYNPYSHDWHPNGHPSENRVIFESGETGHENIFIMNHDGSGIVPIFTDGHRRRAADLSSNCRFITYTKYFGDNSEVYYMDLDTGIETRITENIEWDGHPAFTPDDKYIIFEQNINNIGIMTLYELATGRKITVTDATSSDSDGSALFE